ncbi:MAG: sensor histidine kinase [Cyanobacteriota bacterium]
MISTYAISSKQITLDLNNIDAVYLDINTAIPCGLILNELVSNSLKYACFEAINYEIVIELKVEDNQVNLIVKDSGKNLPNAITLDKNPSLGLKLVKALVAHIDGQIEVEQSPCTTFRIEFPLS